MEKSFTRLAVTVAAIVVGLVLACVVFPEVRALVPDWLVDN